MSLRRLLSRCVLFCAVVTVTLEAQPPGNGDPPIIPADQRVVPGNACGPTALLNAFRFGSKEWRRASDAVAGTTDKERIVHIIRKYGMRASTHVPGHPRWSRRGVSVADLGDMADEMTTGLYLPHPGNEIFFLKTRETPDELLGRVHQRLKKSLARGLPPVVSLRRYVLRAKADSAPQWVELDAHFVTLTTVPARLEKNARAFSVEYIDPWGGRRCQGSIGIPARTVFPDASGNSSCLEALFPEASVGATHISKVEISFIAVGAAIGRW